MENVNETELKNLQTNGQKLLVDFWASWCMPCKTLIPRLESLDEKYPNVKFVKVNVDDNPNLALSLNIRSIPTVIVYDGENMVERLSGLSSDEVYKNILDKL